MTDTQKLKAKIVESGLTQAKVANKLGISVTSFNNKLLNRSSFKASEMFCLCELLNIRKDEDAKSIFFAQNSE